MTTQAQYHAASMALYKLAHSKIEELPFYARGMAAQALSPEVIQEFAKAAVDAAISMPVVPEPHA